MARRKDHTRVQLKEMSLLAGQKILQEEGIPSFSARKIAKEIGYTVGTVYNVFDNHYDLIMQVNIVTLNEWYLSLEKELIGLKGLDKALALASGYVELSFKDYNRWLLLLEYEVPHEILRPEWYSEKTKKVFDLINSAIIECGIPENEVQHYSMLFWSIVQGACLLSLTRKIDLHNIEAVNSMIEKSLTNLFKR